MFTKSIKTTLAAALLAIGTAATVSAPANAGSNFGVYIGGGHGSGVYFGNGHRSPSYNNGHRRHRSQGHRSHRRVGCGPRRALNQAYRYGMNRPNIKRINERKIVVTGWNRGHRAKIVFSRYGRGCQIIKARGI